MRIGQLANRSGVSVKAVRFYERSGLLPAAARLPSGYRDFDDTAVARLRFVRAAQAAALTLAEIRQVLAIRDRDQSPCQHVTALLDAHLADLDTRISALGAVRRDLAALRAQADLLDPADCDPEAVCQVIQVAAPAATARP